MPTYSEIRVDVADGVATLTLNRPEERNAMTPAMGEEVQDACRELTSLPGLRAVIVTGAGCFKAPDFGRAFHPSADRKSAEVFQCKVTS